jgi:hypothetical protein
LVTPSGCSTHQCPELEVLEQAELRIVHESVLFIRSLSRPELADHDSCRDEAEIPMISARPMVVLTELYGGAPARPKSSTFLQFFPTTESFLN